MMGFLKRVLWLLSATVVAGLSFTLASHYQVTERLEELFFTIQGWLPMSVSFEQFLIFLTLASLVVIGGCVGVLVVMAGRYAFSQTHGAGQMAASRKELEYVREDHRRQYEQLLALGQSLTTRLEKRVLLQTIVEVAARVTSEVHANSLVSLWLVQSDTDMVRFEAGYYCDASLFMKSEYQLSEQPFARLMATKDLWVVPQWGQVPGFINRERSLKVGAAGALLIVPCVVEGRVIAAIVVLCHPNFLKGYDAQRTFYQAVWVELTLAAVVAVQGAATIVDRLTGMHTREYFMTRLLQEIERASRYQSPIALLMIDIDNFKLVNDKLGHQQGDAALKMVARLIKREVRAIDLVGRYGGEEFVVLLPETGYGEDSGHAMGALVVASRIRKSVDEEFHGLQHPLNLTISVGVAARHFPQDRQMTHQDLIRLADEQLYRAKTTGKNRVCSIVTTETG